MIISLSSFQQRDGSRAIYYLGRCFASSEVLAESVPEDFYFSSPFPPRRHRCSPSKSALKRPRLCCRWILHKEFNRKANLLKDHLSLVEIEVMSRTSLTLGVFWSTSNITFCDIFFFISKRKYGEGSCDALGALSIALSKHLQSFQSLLIFNPS